MPNQDPWTTLDAALGALRAHDADVDTVDRIRERCLAQLAAARRRQERRRSRLAAHRRWLEPAFALGLAALYLAAIVPRALALLR